MKQVMLKAWEIAREGVKKFGGKVKEYFAEALRMAWRIVKKGGSNMKKVKLVGSPKQIAWAEDLRKVVVASFEIAKEFAKNSDYNQERLQNAINYFENEVLSKEKAEFYIDKFQTINVRELKKLLNSDVEYKHIKISDIIRNVDFRQFRDDFREKGYKFAKGLSVLQMALRDYEAFEKNLAFVEGKLK